MHIDIASLSPAEQQALYDRLAYQLRDRPDTFEATPEERAFWDLVGQALRSSNIKLPPIYKFIPTFGRAKFAGCMQDLEELVAEALPPVCRRTVKDVVRVTILKALADRLRGRGIEMTPTFFLRNFGALRQAVERSYPGYIEARLLHHVAKIAA